ncbi:MAG: YicC family protein [Rhodospirillales bacterium]|nr:MAG: YicC family protein [Rhodospirillales bacterium]
MTGYARAEGADGPVTWVWEARSVNGRALETRLRVPPGMERLEHPARAAVGDAVKRGNVSLSLSMLERRGRQPVRIDRELVRELLGIVSELRAHGEIDPPTADGLLRVRGVIEEETGVAPSEAEIAARDAAIMATLKTTMKALVEARASEGARLAAMLDGHLAQIAELRDRAEGRAAAQGDVVRTRFETQLADILGRVPALSAERLAQEIALQVGKADVREELDRLKAHLSAARELMAAAGPATPVGRKFDFLCQEFNREANTLCSKSADIELTRIGIDLKSAIEQLREQVQNVE